MYYMQVMLSDLLSPPYAPFALAFVIMVGVGLIEALGLGLGQIDLGADLDADTGSLLDWLGIGSSLPILVWLTSLLGCFVIGGVALQQIATGIAGAPLPWAFATGAALAVGGVANRFAARGLARVFPSYESSVISTDDLIMRRGVVLEGVARRGQPARAKVVDQHKQAHFVMVEPQYDHEQIAAGQTALLVRREGTLFFGLPDADTALTPL